MFSALFWTVAGLLGSGVGIWVAALFVPQAALVLKAGLDFLRSPLGTVIGAIALGFVLFAAGWIEGDLRGSNVTRAAWRADVAAKEKAAAEREIALRLEMKRLVDAGLGTDAQFGKSIDEKVSQDAKVSGDACRRATDDDIRRLRAIH